MTSRGEAIALGLAVIGHILLFAILSLVWAAKPAPLPTPRPIEVSLVDAVALDQHAPAAPEPPSQSAAPDPGPPADAPPPAKAEKVAPDPAPPRPEAEAAPLPRPAPLLPSPSPSPPKPAPKAPAEKKPVAEKAAKPDKARATPAKAAAPGTKALAATRTTGANPRAEKAKQTGSLLDDDFRKGLTQSPSREKVSEAAPGATMDAKAAANIGSAILRQVQPCANRQVIPGPGANHILATVRLQINRDGSLAARPTITDHAGVDDDNRIYIDAVDRAALATFIQCAPLRGLPPELYDVPNGWKVFRLRYKMPG